MAGVIKNFSRFIKMFLSSSHFIHAKWAAVGGAWEQMPIKCKWKDIKGRTNPWPSQTQTSSEGIETEPDAITNTWCTSVVHICRDEVTLLWEYMVWIRSSQLNLSFAPRYSSTLCFFPHSWCSLGHFCNEEEEGRERQVHEYCCLSASVTCRRRKGSTTAWGCRSAAFVTSSFTSHLMLLLLWLAAVELVPEPQLAPTFRSSR